MKKIKYKYIYLSDLHIQSETDERGLLFLNFLKSIDYSYVEKIIFLGDVFEFFLGTRLYFKKKFKNIGDALEEISQNGVEVYFIQGNHEFFLDSIKWKGVRFIKKKDFKMTLDSRNKVILAHGDLLGDSLFYKIYYSFVHSSFIKYMTYLLPASLLDRFCLKISELSRKRSAGTKIPHKKILHRLIMWVKNENYKQAIVGHFHVPYNYLCPKSDIRIMCLDSWDKPSFLAYEDNNFKRVYLKDL